MLPQSDPYAEMMADMLCGYINRLNTQRNGWNIEDTQHSPPKRSLFGVGVLLSGLGIKRLTTGHLDSG